MAGGSLRQIRVKVLIIKHLYEKTRVHSCMFIHVYTRSRARPSNVFEVGEPAKKGVLLSKVKFFPMNYSEKIFLLSTLTRSRTTSLPL
jgi:hypothetical protein